MTRKDTLYGNSMERIEPFRFGREVAEVFDDMAARSIPLYHETQETVSDLALEFYQKESTIYDIGCSTGNTLVKIAEKAQGTGKSIPRMCGIDMSADMITSAKNKCRAFDINWICGGAESQSYPDASVVIALYVLQFIDISSRPAMIKEIFNGLRKGGLFLYAEKLRSQDEKLETVLTGFYHDYKRRMGYSDLEIRQKDSALRGVLIPLTLNENIELLSNAGFRHSEILLKFMNFTSFMAVK